MSAIQTKYGEFNAVDNGNGGVSLFVGDKKIIEFPNIAWWNLSAIEDAIGENIELVNKRIDERVDKLKIAWVNVLAEQAFTFGKCTQMSNKWGFESILIFWVHIIWMDGKKLLM